MIWLPVFYCGGHIWVYGACVCHLPKHVLFAWCYNSKTDSNRSKTNTIYTFIAMLVYQKDILIYHDASSPNHHPPPVASSSPPLDYHPSIVTGAAVGVVVMTGGALVPQGVAKGSKPKSLPKRWGWWLMMGQLQWFLMFFLCEGGFVNEKSQHFQLLTSFAMSSWWTLVRYVFLDEPRWGPNRLINIYNSAVVAEFRCNASEVGSNSSCASLLVFLYSCIKKTHTTIIIHRLSTPSSNTFFSYHHLTCHQWPTTPKSSLS